MAPQTSTKLTYEDYLHIPEDGRRHEIIDGEHYVSPGANSKHAIVVMNLIHALDGFVRARRLGRVFSGRYDVVLSDINVVEPDVFFVSNSRLQMITKANFSGAPDLVVEVLSEGNRRHDEVVKKKAYELFGVLEYWIVDPELDALKTYRRGGDVFGPAEILSAEAGDTIITPLLPGFSLNVPDVFAE